MLCCEPPELVVDGCSVRTSGVSVGCVIVGTGAGWTVTGAMGVAGADMGLIGLTGLVGFVGFVSDFTQVFEDVTQEPNNGVPYGSGQVLVLTWVIDPTNPAWQDSV